MSTMVMDYRNNQFETVEGITNHEDGTITVNLDILMAGKFETDEHTWEDGKMGNTFAAKYGAQIKLAGRPRMYGGTLLHDFYLFSGWEAGNFHRTECGGPLVEGPYASLFQLGTMVTAHRQPTELAYLIQNDDKVVLRGTTYTVQFDRSGKYPKLSKVQVNA